ncbi:phosphomannomutase [Streptomyces alboflavus]|uniref:Phosphomannomutase n=1 Tax=Streptomyces alboflavus TaxID=67267 RepID=A0A1Z1WHX1_9ACTN|nr:phosphomannomutase [Streptomyces alboflavus]
MQDHGELIARAQAWLAEDPDPETREELAKLVDAAPGSPAVLDELAARFAGTLQFGTAGLRGELGAGPLRMNRSVVIRAAAGLAAYLKGKGHTDGLVVIGYDARYKSADFARDTAAVMTGAGLRAAVLPRPLPTPVLAFAIRHLGAVAGVEVTASHNPPRDNGYKVYLGDGSQIVPPADGEIAAEIAAVRSLHDVPRPEGGWQTLGEDVLEAYLARTDAVLAQGSPGPPGPSTRPCTASARTRSSRRSRGPVSPRRCSSRSRRSPTRTSRRSPSRTRRSRARWTWRSPRPARPAPTW